MPVVSIVSQLRDLNTEVMHYPAFETQLSRANLSHMWLGRQAGRYHLGKLSKPGGGGGVKSVQYR